MRKGKYLWVFALALVLFAFFSAKVSFHDSHEYITIAKALAGFGNVALFSTHSIVYSVLMAGFIKLAPFLFTIKIFNVLWIFLIGVALYFNSGDKRAFVLFAFSPLGWIAGIQTTPVLAAAFFFTLAYVFFKRDSEKNFYLSGLFLGVSIAFYTPMIIVAFFFLLAFFWNKKFSSFFFYFVFLSFGILPRVLIDYVIFQNPAYSFARYVGTNALILLGLNPNISSFQLFSGLDFLFVFFVISPLLYRIVSLDRKKYKKELVFIIPTFLIFWVRGGLIKYFLIISPVVLMILADTLKRKEIRWHCVISSVIVLVVFFNYVSFTDDVQIRSDLERISEDYQIDYLIAEGHNALRFATFLWDESPEIVWEENFLASINNRTVLREYQFDFKPDNLELNSFLVFEATFVRPDSESYDSFVFVAQEDFVSEDLKKDKCYNVLCVYK